MSKEPIENKEYNNKELKGIRGSILTFKDNPFLNAPDKCYDFIKDGLIVITNGHIVDVGDYQTVIERNEPIGNIDVYRNSVIMPGFIDCHTHYVQSSIIGSFGNKLIDWLNQYTFPTESKFKDKRVAETAAKVFFRQILSHGTTTANVFATTFEESVDAFFEESMRYNTRMISGKVLQNRNVPASLCDKSAEESVEISEHLLNKWHGQGRQLYAVIPRFAPTSTSRQLRLAGELYQKYIDRGVYLHSHLDESVEEVKWVAELFPYIKNYAEVYDCFGMLGHLTVMAHCCVVNEDEWQILHDKDCAAIHCPSSNLFLGGGQFKYWEAMEPSRPVKVGMGSDIGGGTGFSIIRELADAYKVAMIGSHNLDAIHSLYMATRGGAEALHLEDKIGSIKPGYEADLAVVSLNPDSFTSWRLNYALDIFEKLFALITLSPGNLVSATYVAGHKVFDRMNGEQFSYSPNFKD
ncbi:MAG: guanine deaminase [Muribaculaceae bacterium]|nr:guanine deaminase [Muribaculaceae bacterium]